MIITDKVKITFFSACKEAAFFVQDEDSAAEKMNSDYEKQFFYHCMSFLYCAWPYYLAENSERAENNQHLKTVDDLGSDFILSACGHGVGFFERGVSDWLYSGDILDKIATKYFYSCYSFSADDNGELIGE